MVAFGRLVRTTGSQLSVMRRIEYVPLISGGIVVVVVFAAIFANFLAPHNPVHTSLADSRTPPVISADGAWKFVMGTDLFGRDILSRIIFGARISLTVALGVLALATFIGVTLGTVAGYFGGLVDGLIMRMVDIALSFPPLLIAIVLAVVFGPSFLNVILIISLVYWPLTARQVRAETLAIRQQDFVALARTSGASNLYIMYKHVIPNVLPTILVITTLQVGTVILFEAGLSFLGVGVPPPNPSWGTMVSDGRNQIATSWWISFFPGISIILVVLALNVFGDWLRDRWDPRLRQL